MGLSVKLLKFVYFIVTLSKFSVSYDNRPTCYSTSVSYSAKNSGICGCYKRLKKFQIYVFLEYQQTGPTFNCVFTSFVVVLFRSEFHLFVGIHPNRAHSKQYNNKK